MRKNFEKNEDKRVRFQAQFIRFGTKKNYRGRPTTTLLFNNIISLDGKISEDHIWFSMTKGFEKYEKELSEGTLVEFDARIKCYTKGYVNWRKGFDERQFDYKLSHPTKIVIIKPEQ